MLKKEKSSFTSLVASFSRAYHSQYDQPKIFNDFIAKELITPSEYKAIKTNMIQGVQFFNKEIAEKLKNDEDEILKWIIQTQLSPTPLARAAYCEQILLHELNLGVKQYVILGAGLDTFSFRHPELQKVLDIFEIDHPATQAFKRRRLTEVHLKLPPNLYFFPMDFTQLPSGSLLAKTGINRYEKTLFSLLGVTYYLTKEEIGNLISHLFAYAPAGSSIIFDYADENLFSEKGYSNRVKNMVNMAAASGEPMRSCFSYHELEQMLEKSNLLIYEYLSPACIHKRFFENRSDYLSAFETIHYVHAVKS
ncbi:methyltransferase, TIGR00027 family [Terribacillus aidingensis]|uniref:S-adenosyl-L-methionine-dependent methyltransferase n=1 Tax=Terribacillus aidingensis TaxID=586416 RepID=A0A285NYZ0_9BACI|nr:class I SAM-dependent methyltransferase [Terribacillus aidingensis]SNZ14669.1 methyltransferase, TIGR00027 family [Terribacillus aidingensis]